MIIREVKVAHAGARVFLKSRQKNDLNDSFVDVTDTQTTGVTLREAVRTVAHKYY